MTKEEMQRQSAENGFCLFPQVLSAAELERARDALDRGVEMTRKLMGRRI